MNAAKSSIMAIFSKKIIASFLVFFMSFTAIVCSQSVGDFEKLNAENGIYQSVIYNLQQDQSGNIWMATEEGVVKYNSVFADSYTKQKGLPGEVGNRVNTLFIDSKDRVWLGIDKGICLYDEKYDTFQYIQPKASFKPNLVKSICEDNNGNIWIGAYNGLWLYNHKTSEFSNKTAKLRYVFVSKLS